MLSQCIHTKYEIGETLGTGAFSEVKIGTCRQTGKKFAIKIVDRTKCKGKEDMVETEVHILNIVKHENIVQLYEKYQIDDKIYLVLELVTGGELFDEITRVGAFPEIDASHMVKSILLAVEYLHSKGIVHRDLKPENLLMTTVGNKKTVKLSDFGLSKVYNNTMMKTACGTPGYVGNIF